MSTRPDDKPENHPDSPPPAPERWDDEEKPGDEPIERKSPMEDPGSPGGTTGTGGTNHEQDR